MSVKNLLDARCDILRLDQTDIDGAPAYAWLTVATFVKVRVDLSYRRPGKDQGWIAEAGRPVDRAGVAFFMPDVDLHPGDRLVVTGAGIAGTYEVDGAFDKVPGRKGVSHLEVGVSEVAQALS